MTSRRIVPRSLILWLLVLSVCCCIGEKLSPDQKAPLFARGSGGLILNTPFEDNKARKSPVASANVNVNANAEDGVQREETEMLKEVDGELVRIVKGSFSYNSPEGLPISVKYEADENGNRASFKFGTGGGTGSGTSGRPSGPKGGNAGNRGGQTGQGPKKGSKSDSYLPPKDVDRSYLPPQ
ncbi:uncharacterized protein LOC128872566 [Hylaeus volcanicus]|uniref:uncharacterized protein LOC128872566 n=1 Tax=Hylaeus volcanicus TaxID=313075 RepID=UPI0023B7BB82|nr:uncharacterized protein LOC128872566 [Hylaeus volcanicus]